MEGIRADIGYPTTTDIIPDLLVDILNDMVGVNNFFFYDFRSSDENELVEEVLGRTTLTSWNYAGSPVPIPPTLWLFGSGIVGLVGMSRRKKV